MPTVIFKLAGGCSAFLCPHKAQGQTRASAATLDLPSCLRNGGCLRISVQLQGPESPASLAQPVVQVIFWTIASFMFREAVPSTPLATVGNAQGRRRLFCEAGWSWAQPAGQPGAPG